MKGSAKLLAGWLVKCQAIDIEEYDLYLYAACSFIMTLTPLFLSILVGGFMGNLVNGIEIIFPFMIIRKFSGGYHAKSPWICVSCSVLVLSVFFYISNFVIYGYRLIILTGILSVSLIIFSPVVSENRMLDTKERFLYKRVTTILVGLSILTSILCFKFGLNIIAKNILLGVILTGLLQIPCLLKKKYRN